MNQEEYGVVLTAETSKFKKKLNEMSKYIKAFGEGAEESFKTQWQEFTDSFKPAMKELQDGMKNFGKKAEEGFVAPDISTGYDKQIEYVKDQLDAVADQINAIKNGGGKGNLTELEAQYQILLNKLEVLTDKQDEFNSELNEMNQEGVKGTNVLGNLFDKSIGKIKRFTYYLLGARSVFSLFMRYRNIYYQYNEEMQYQSELSQNAIALSLAPAFEFLGNVITYASIGLAKFIELLTGTNVLSKVSTKGIRDYNKSLKETQTLVSGIDEITNLTNPQNLGLASQYKALQDFQEKVAEVEKWFEENTWVADFANGLKDIVNYISEHWDIFKYIIGGVMLTSIFGLPLVGGIASLIISINLLGIDKALAELAELKGAIDKVVPVKEEEYHIEMLNRIDKLKEKLKTLPKNSTEYAETLKEINQLWEAVNGTTKRGSKDILKYENEVKKIAKELDKETGNLNRYTRTIEASLKIGKERQEWDNRSVLTQWGDWFTNAEKTHTAYIQNMETEYESAFKHITDDFNTMINKMNRIKLDKKIIDIGVEYNIPKSTVQSLIDKVRGISVNLFGMPEATFNNIANNVLQKFGFGKAYAKGLDYVPYDNYPALLHKGEAVVPAKYNPTIHSEGNEYTNSLLETLIIKMDDVANRPIEFNVDGEKLARTTYPLLQNEARNYQYNEGVSR